MSQQNDKTPPAAPAAAATLPQAWATLEAQAMTYFCHVAPAEIRAALRSAIAAGLDPADLSGMGCGTVTRPASPFALLFGDWQAGGAYVSVTASGAMRVSPVWEGFIRGEPYRACDE
jgi:hypothetical protein